jgi:NAD(P)H-dependent FMN reductase
MRILAFAASNSLVSINDQLISYATNYLREQRPDIDIERVHLSDYEIPFYRPDREEASGVPSKAREFYDLITTVDAVIISFAEHNGGNAAVYKNLFDWTSRIDIKVYQNKPCVLLSTSPGRGGAARSLKQAVDSASHFGMDLVATASLPSFNHTFDKDNGVVTDEQHKQEIDKALNALLSD